MHEFDQTSSINLLLLLCFIAFDDWQKFRRCSVHALKILI